MAIVSCPDCGKKLKVSDASVGKKVKCSCGNVFVAEEEAEAAPVRRPMATAAVAEKVTVACTECSSPLKVGAASLGKKMKCPKCAAVFVAAVEEEDDAPPPVKKGAKPRPPVIDDDDMPKSKAKPKAKATTKDDDMDALWGFAQDEAEADDMPPPKAKAKPGKKSFEDDDEDDDMPKPKRKASSSRSTPAADAKPEYPRRTLLNLFVLFMLMVNMALGGVIFLGFVDTEKDLGIPRPKSFVKAPPKIGGKKNQNTGELIDDAKTTLADLEKREQGWLTELKTDKASTEPLAAFATAEGNFVSAVFSPNTPMLATLVTGAAEDPAKIELWDLKSAKANVIILLKTASVKPLLRFSPNGEFLAVGSWEERWVKVFNTSDGKEVASPKLEKIDRILSAIGFSADGKLLLVAHDTAAKKEAVVEAWAVGEWKSVPIFYKVDPEASYSFLPDGSRIVAVNAQTHKVTFYGGKDDEVEKKCDAKVGNEHYALSYDGSLLAFAVAEAGGGTAIFVNDLKKDANNVKELTKTDFVVGRIQFSADSKYILFTDAKNGRPHVMDLAEGKPRWLQPDGLFLSNAGVLAAQVVSEPSMPTRVMIRSFSDLIAAQKDPGKDPNEGKKDGKTTDAKDPKDGKSTDKKDLKDGKTTDAKDPKDGKSTDKKDLKDGKSTDSKDSKDDKATDKKDLKDGKSTDSKDSKDDKATDKKDLKDGKDPKDDKATDKKDLKDGKTKDDKATDKKEPSKDDKSTDAKELKDGKTKDVKDKDLKDSKDDKKDLKDGKDDKKDLQDAPKNAAGTSVNTAPRQQIFIANRERAVWARGRVMQAWNRHQAA